MPHKVSPVHRLGFRCQALGHQQRAQKLLRYVALSDYSMEHFEIASYKAIIAAAEAIGETAVAETCRQILHDEEEMAHWLEEHLPEVVAKHLGHQRVA